MNNLFKRVDYVQHVCQYRNGIAYVTECRGVIAIKKDKSEPGSCSGLKKMA